MHEKFESYFSPAGLPGKRSREVVCALCGEDLLPGDRYFHLDGKKICEHCLTAYARRYFEGDLRRIGEVAP